MGPLCVLIVLATPALGTVLAGRGASPTVRYYVSQQDTAVENSTRDVVTSVVPDDVHNSTEITPTSSEKRKGSHLRLNRVIESRTSRSVTAPDTGYEKFSPKHRQIEEDQPQHFIPIEQIKGNDRESYYYTDFGTVPNADHLLRMNEMSIPTRTANYLQNQPPFVDKHSCRQYLEFLKYAFTQLENMERNADYEFIDEGYKRAGVIVPNVDLLKRVGVNELDGYKQGAEGGEQYTTEAAILKRTNLATEQTTKTVSESMDEGGDESGMRRAADPRDDGCHEKLFPCPDNLNVTYPVNGFCNRFVVCESGKPMPEFCPEGLHFNLVTRKCDLPHNSFCTYSCPREHGYFGIPGDCEGFFKCSNWYPEYRACPPKMHWDVKAKICTFEDLSSCPLKCNTPYEIKPYNGVCNAYVICTKGKPTFHKCPSGTYFDIKSLRCVSKGIVKCENDSDYIVRNRGLQNGLRMLCAKIELRSGISDWCQETSDEDEK